MSDKVLVVDAQGQALSPCQRDKAEQLVAQQKAAWLTHDPPTIQLQRRVAMPQPQTTQEPSTLAGQRLLVHICCGPCATYTVQRLREQQAEVVGYWFNPNIHPYSEHERRRQTLADLASQIDLAMLWEPGYAMPTFMRAVCGHEQIGERCLICYRQRLERTAQRAAEAGFDAYTTTLLISPYQNMAMIQKVGEELGQRYGVAFYLENFRRGFAEHYALAKSYGLYQQHYCGCLYSEWEALDRSASTGSRPPPSAP